MKRRLFILCLLPFFLAGCFPQVDNPEEVIQENNKTQEAEKSIVPNYQISDSYYRTALPFTPSGSRGTIVYNLSSRYDSDEFEEGLLRLAQKVFPTDEYIFQEGQYLDEETVTRWLSRKMTAAQLKEKGMSEEQNLGLNPVVADENNAEEQEKNPIYLSHILEHNFLKKSEKNKVKPAGLSIGLAMNSVYYYTVEEKGGGTKESKVKISEKKIMEKGTEMAQEIVKRLRQKKEVGDVPILVGIYKLEDRTSVVPGHFIAYGYAEKGTSLKWETVNEKYVLFPSSEAKKYSADYKQFQTFQDQVSEYFPNYNGIVGRAFYVDDELKQLKIDISMQFYGKTEVIGFAQYIAGLLSYFPKQWSVEVNLKSQDGMEALILWEPDMDEPFVHIY
jgi:protein involved in sex pheromone biosynthesis